VDLSFSFHHDCDSKSISKNVFNPLLDPDFANFKAINLPWAYSYKLRQFATLNQGFGRNSKLPLNIFD
jgi:hypothetical protein